MWSVNGQIFDCDTPAAQIPEGSGEVWVFQNNSGGWQHPIHVHFEEFMVLERNGAPPPPFERGRKDVARLGYGSEMKVFMRFRDFTGRYMMHCHNSTHEDHAMMVRWDIVPR
jgi:FtsP/CotA-like multicopper oxidase with cupredoxin domain